LIRSVCRRRDIGWSPRNLFYLNGFNHRESYGAHSYFIDATAGNWLIDLPRFMTQLVKKFQAMGGILYLSPIPMM
jgi:hypothetical protein